MVTVKASLDAGWSGATLTLVALRDGVSLGTASVSTSTVESVTLATATIDLSAAGGGAVILVIRDDVGSVAWTNSREIDSAGEDITATFTSAQANKIATIGTANATVAAPVTTDGVITRIVIGDDYKAVNARAFEFTVADPGNVTPGTATCTFAASHAEGRSSSWSVSGTVTANGSDFILAYELARATTGNLLSGLHKYSVTLFDDSGNEVTQIQGTARVVERN